MNKNFQIIIRIVLVLMVLSQAKLCAAFKRIEGTSYRENEKAVKASKGCFYGKVFDLDGTPIEHATVLGSFESKEKGKAKSFSVKSDVKGEFEVTAKTDKWVLSDITRSGYVFDRRKTDDYEYRLLNLDENDGVGSKNNPAVFYLKKISTPAVIQSMFSYAFIPTKQLEYKINLDDSKPKNMMAQGQNQNVNRENLLRRARKSAISGPDVMPVDFSQAPNLDKNTVNCQDDLMLTAVYLEGEGAYELNFHALEGTDGFFLSEKMLLDAPSEGYQKQVSYLVPSGQGKKNKGSEKYVYVKARDGEIYSRLTVSTKIYPRSLQVKIVNLSNRGGNPSFVYSKKKHPGKDQQWDYEKKRREQSINNNEKQAFSTQAKSP